MRSMFAALLFSLIPLAAAGCQDARTLDAAPAKLAIADVCAVTVDHTSAFKGEVAVADQLDTIAIDEPGPVDEDPPAEPGGPTIACCANGPCTPMDYDDTVCIALPDASDATLLTTYVEGIYDGPKVPIAYYGGCEDVDDDEDDDDDDQCQPGDGAAVYQNGGDIVGLVVFEDDTQTAFRYYQVDEAGVYKVEDGKVPHAVLAAGHSYYDISKKIFIDDEEVGALNLQTDCLQTKCGQTCSPC